ncbi:MAG: hypothetical protein FJW31_08180 [Acidobacteria bacterium]|nr:hypothetical protein [Acidobacteriota bacterium]
MLVESGKPKTEIPVYWLSLDTGEKNLLLQSNPTDGSYSSPMVSYDGRQLFMAMGNSNLRLVAAPLTDAGRPAGPPQPVPGVRNLGFFALTPDDRHVIFSYYVAMNRGLYRIPAGGGAVEALAWSGPGAQSPEISANGRLAFSRDTRDTNLWRLNLDSAALEPQPVATSSFREVVPQYSPDGRRLAFFSNRGGSLQIWTSEANGSHPTQLTFFSEDGTTGSPRWSPDGRSIAFDSNAGSTSFHLFVAPADGGKPRQLTSRPASDVVAAWSPDRQWVYFSSYRTGQSQIGRVAVTGGEPQQVTQTGGESVQISPDCAWLYFIRDIGRGGLWRRPIAGGPENRVAESVYRSSYAVTSRGAYYCTWPGPAGLSSIRWTDPSTGSSREIYAPPKPIDLGMAVSPDHRHLIFAQNDYRVADLMFVERF